ncbi:MAG: ABC transporter substrate-binding protein [Chloroflexota bacterium]
MLKARRYLLISIAVLLLAALALPLAAQDAPGPGEGAPIVWPNFGGDPTNFNPIMINDGSSQIVANLIFPDFLRINAETGSIDPLTPRSIAESWTVSDDGRTYTFKIRDDYFWSDGTPVSSQDVKYAFDAIQSGEVETPLTGFFSSIESLEAPDDQTVVVTFTEADCSALSTLKTIPPVPSHIFSEQFGTDYAQMNDADFNLNPSVSGGIFSFSNFRPGEQTTLVANQDYPDAPGGVIPEGFIFRQLASQTVVVDEFLSGNLTLIDSVPEDREAELKEMAANGDVQLYEALSSGWQYLAFNLADPTNPQDGQDADGNPIDQGHHPVFGDLRVRQAFAYAIDYASLNQGAFSGNGIPVASPLLTTSWAYNEDLQPYPYNPEMAMQLLDEAGWIDDDNDPTTPRVAQGALYAEDGTTLSFDLTSYSGNTSVESSLLLMQDQLDDVGFQANLDILEFQTMLEKLDGQTFDTIMLFLGGFDTSNPDELRALYTAEGDVVNSGFNGSSYDDPELADLFAQARTVPGCDQVARKEIYDEIQQRIHDDLPMYFVNTSVVPSVAQPDLENWNPELLSFSWNIYAWSQVPR